MYWNFHIEFELDIFTNNDEASMMLDLRNGLIRGRLEQLEWISLYSEEQKIARSCRKSYSCSKFCPVDTWAVEKVFLGPKNVSQTTHNMQKQGFLQASFAFNLCLGFVEYLFVKS